MYTEDDFQQFRTECHNYMVSKERKIIDAWCKEAKLDEPVGYSNDFDSLTIYTNHPGILIGRAGALVYKYQDLFRKEFNRPDAKIKFVEIKSGFANY